MPYMLQAKLMKIWHKILFIHKQLIIHK